MNIEIRALAPAISARSASLDNGEDFRRTTLDSGNHYIRSLFVFVFTDAKPEEEPKMKSTGTILRLIIVALMFVVSAGAMCARAAGQSAAEISTSDIHIALSATGAQPHLVWISGQRCLTLRNRTPETLPASIESMAQTGRSRGSINPIWIVSDPRHVIFVYESAAPHLQLALGVAGARGFRPHRASHYVENLGEQESGCRWWIRCDSTGRPGSR